MGTLKSCIKRSKMRVFRRIYMKRRQSSGEYESTWQQVPSRYIKNFGTISYDSDSVMPNFFKFSDFTFSVVNNDGYFSDTDNSVSFWYGYLSRYRTMVKVSAGYIDTDETEWPTSTTLFIGLIKDNIKQNYDNTVQIKAKHLSEIFKEVPANQITGLGATQTASDIITKVRDFLDSNSISVFQKYISLTAWHIATTTTNYNMATTVSLDYLTTWEMMEKFAAAENHVMYVDRSGDFYFKDRTNISSTTSFKFSGIGDLNPEYGHNILSNLTIDDGVDKVYNRIRIQIGEDETLTSYYTKSESWNWADSSSSFLYGVRTYAYENTWMNTACAVTVAQRIYDEFSWPKLEIEFDSKFVPQLNLFDRASLYYRTRSAIGGDLWGHFDWGHGTWAGQGGFNINISNNEYAIIKLTHNLDKFTSTVRLREI